MNLGETVKGLFNRKKSLDKVSVDELRKEKIALEQQEVKFSRQIGKLEQQKTDLFRKGTELTSDREQKVLARKIKDFDSQAQNLDQNGKFINRQLRILNGFMQLKENENLLKNYGLSNLINNMDLDKLQNYIEQATVGRQFNLDKFQDIIGKLEEGEGLVNGEDEESDVLDIVAAMQASASADEDDQESAVEKGIKQVNEILHQKEDEELI
jgi:hypothetical protein